MDVYKIDITMPDGSRRKTHTLADEARNAQRAFGVAAQIKGFTCHWDTLEIVGNDIEIKLRHNKPRVTPKKRLREFECSFRGPEGTVDSDVFEARCVEHARTVARALARDRHALPLLDTIRPATRPA